MNKQAMLWGTVGALAGPLVFPVAKVLIFLVGAVTVAIAALSYGVRVEWEGDNERDNYRN